MIVMLYHYNDDIFLFEHIVVSESSWFPVVVHLNGFSIHGVIFHQLDEDFSDAENAEKMSIFPFNTLRLEQDILHLAYDILKCVFLKEIICISIQISPKFVSARPVGSVSHTSNSDGWKW